MKSLHQAAIDMIIEIADGYDREAGYHEKDGDHATAKKRRESATNLRGKAVEAMMKGETT